MQLRFTSQLILTILVIVRLLPHDDPSMTNATEEAQGTVRFAPVKLTLSSVDLVAMVKRPSHLSLVFWTAPLKRSMISWAIVLSGDVQLNPGPPSSCKYPCTVCSNPVKANQKGIQCDTCDLWSHATCGNVGEETYLNLAIEGDWHCPSCIRSQLPFHNISNISNAALSSNSALSTSTNSSTMNNKINSIKCQSLNARSVMNKRTDMLALLRSQSLNILAVTETFLDEDILDSELIDDNFTIFRRDRNRHGGGVMLVVDATIPAKRRQDLETDCELLWIELSLSPTNILFGVFYNPPDSSGSTLVQLSSSLKAIINTSTPIIISGDFNLPNIDWSETSPSPTTYSTKAHLLCELLDEFNLQQLVTEPTRNSNILDLLITNREDLIQGSKVVDGIPGSDHESVQFGVNLTRKPLSRHKRRMYNFRKADFEAYRELLSKVPWNCCFLTDSIEDCWRCFKDVILSVADQCIPKITLKPRKRKFWLSDETLLQIRRKRRAYKLAKRTAKSQHLNKYRNLSNKVRNMTRKDHLHHLQDITSNLHTDQRPFWRWLKNIRGHRPQIPEIHHEGAILSTPIQKANAFCTFFASKFVKENSASLGKIKKDLVETSENVTDLEITEDKVYELLRKIDVSKACGPDDIPGRLLKEGGQSIAGPLSKVFSLSMAQGKLPQDWISANVTPIFKKGNKHLVSNYRPVSLTSITVKLFERIIFNHLTNFLQEHKKLSPFQHGFRKGHSCQTQLLETIHQWADTLDKSGSSHVIYLDFSKAFDTVPHKRLLLKLEHIGIKGELLDWIKGFLSNRRQRVLCDGVTSCWEGVISGVPQGSILGPLLFIIYVNDIGDNISSHTRLFADDCTIYRDVSSKQDCDSLQEDLNQLYNWTQKWQLSLNTSKCKVMSISNKRITCYYTYSINNCMLEWVDTYKYLGVIIHKKLSWGEHIQEATLKASGVLNLLRRTMHGTNRAAKERAYIALVRPHLEYCSAVWNPHQKKYISELEKLQKRAARWVCGVRWDKTTNKWAEAYSTSCHRLGWLSLQNRRNFLDCCQTFKVINGLDCINHEDYFTRNLSNRRSNSCSLFISQARINAFRYSFFINAPHMWNKLPVSVVQSPTLASFKSTLLRHYFEF